MKITFFFFFKFWEKKHRSEFHFFIQLVFYNHSYDDINHNSNTIHIQTQADSVVQVQKRLSTSGFGLWETQFLQCQPYYLTPPYARRILRCLRSLSIEIRKNPNPTLCLNGRNSTFCLHGPISTDSLSKSSNSQDHLFRAWRHPHSNPISCLGFIMTNGDCHILCAQAYNCTQWLYTRTLYPKSSKPYQTEW